MFAWERSDRNQRSRQQIDEESHLEFPTLVTLRNHGTDNLGRAPSHGTGAPGRRAGQSAPPDYQPEDSCSAPFPPAESGFFLAFFYLCLSLFSLSFLFLPLHGSPPTLSTTSSGMMLTCLAKPHWFRHSVATAEVYEIPEKDLHPSLIARSSLSMRLMGFISG